MAKYREFTKDEIRGLIPRRNGKTRMILESELKKMRRDGVHVDENGMTDEENDEIAEMFDDIQNNL